MRCIKYYKTIDYDILLNLSFRGGDELHSQ